MPLPLISPDSTNIWVQFWNETFIPVLEASIGSGGGSGWPSFLSKNGRVVEDYADSLKPQLPGSASLAIVLPDGASYVVGGQLYTMDGDTTLGPLTPNQTSWIELTATYDPDSETTVFDFIEHVDTRPAFGLGIVAKTVTLADRTDTVESDGANSDIIPTYPVLMQMLRALGLTEGGGGGGGTTYLSQLKYSPADERNAVVVIEELIANLRNEVTDLIEAGGSKEPPVEVDQLWESVLGLMRGMVEVNPSSMRFLNAGIARPGIYGTPATPDTEQNDRGGTIPEVPEDRVYETT